MSDLKILYDYVPLLLPEISISLDSEYEYGIDYSSFEWCLVSDVEIDEDYSQIFENDQTYEFVGYGGLENYDAIIPQLDITNFRMPDISFAFGRHTLMFSEKAFSALKVSKKLGVNTGNAILTDPFGVRHSGFYYVSFTNPLYKDQAAKRLKSIDGENRPLFELQNGEYDEMVMVHKSTLNRWADLEINCFVDELPEEHIEWWKQNEVEQSYPDRWYRSLEDWQNQMVFKREE